MHSIANILPVLLLVTCALASPIAGRADVVQCTYNNSQYTLEQMQAKAKSQDYGPAGKDAFNAAFQDCCARSKAQGTANAATLNAAPDSNKEGGQVNAHAHEPSEDSPLDPNAAKNLSVTPGKENASYKSKDENAMANANAPKSTEVDESGSARNGMPTTQNENLKVSFAKPESQGQGSTDRNQNVTPALMMDMDLAPPPTFDEPSQRTSKPVSSKGAKVIESTANASSNDPKLSGENAQLAGSESAPNGMPTNPKENAKASVGNNTPADPMMDMKPTSPPAPSESSQRTSKDVEVTESTPKGDESASANANSNGKDSSSKNALAESAGMSAEGANVTKSKSQGVSLKKESAQVGSTGSDESGAPKINSSPVMSMLSEAEGAEKGAAKEAKTCNCAQ